DAGFDPPPRQGLVAAHGREERAYAHGLCIARCRRDRIGLVEERGGGGELSSENEQARVVGERNGKGGQGASVPSEPDPTAGELVPVFVVPQVCGSSPRDSHLTSDQAM